MLSFVRGFEDVKVLANPVGYHELEMFKQRGRQSFVDGSLADRNAISRSDAVTMSSSCFVSD